MAAHKMYDEFKQAMLDGLISSAGGAVELRGKRKKAYLKFDEIVVKRLGPAFWSAELYWKGRKTVSISESIHVDEGGSISFKCLSGRVPFNLQGV